MTVDEDLPAELQEYFPADTIEVSEVLRQVIVSGWAVMSETQRAHLRATLQGQRDLDKRVQKAVEAATKSLLPEDDRKSLDL